MRPSLVMLLLVVAFALGCGPREENRRNAGSASGAGPVAPTPLQAAPQRTDILVDVNGTRLTRAQADVEVDFRLNAMRGQIPPSMLAQARERTLRQVVERFVGLTLLNQEADRQQIVVSEEEEQAAIATVRTQLPPGKTLEEVLTNSPIGEAGMRAELLRSIKIDKLLGPVRTNELAVPPEQIDRLCENTRHARHILVQFAPTDTPQDKEEKKKKAEAIRAKLMTGADFASTAREMSDCPSRQQGGDLGPFPRGRMDPAFEKAAFSQKENEIGPVVETRFGYHIIQVLPLDKDNLRKMLIRELKARQIAMIVNQLRNKAQIHYHPDVAPPPKPTGGPPANVPPAPAGVPQPSGGSPFNPPAAP